MKHTTPAQEGMMSQHTPGPWVIADTRGMYSGEKKYRHSIIGGPQGSIITVADNVRQEADARLIAAAPRMLELLAEYAAKAKDVAQPAPGSLVERTRAILREVEGDNG